VDCPFYTPQGSCEHIDKACGDLVILAPSVCRYCVQTKPDPETRKDSYPVLNRSWGERRKRGLPVGPIPKNDREPVVRTRKREPVVVDLPPAPIVATAEERMEICLDCDRWVNDRCKACTSCKNRPRPLAESGSNCPLRRWARPS
jgi:hypothetical protein